MSTKKTPLDVLTQLQRTYRMAETMDNVTPDILSALYKSINEAQRIISKMFTL